MSKADIAAFANKKWKRRSELVVREIFFFAIKTVAEPLRLFFGRWVEQLVDRDAEIH